MGPSPFWAHIGWGNAGPGEVSRQWSQRGQALSLALFLSPVLFLSFTQAVRGKWQSWTGTLSTLPSLPNGQLFGPHRESESVIEGGSGGHNGDKTLSAGHMDQTWTELRRDVSVWEPLILVASPDLQQSCRDGLRLNYTRASKKSKNERLIISLPSDNIN